MKLKSITIENFTSISQRVTLDLEEGLTALLTAKEQDFEVVVDALSIALGYQWPKAEDFRRNPTGESRQISFTCVFSDVPEMITSDRKYYFRPAAEYMLNEQGELVITRAFRMLNGGLQERAYASAVHPSATGMADLLQVNNMVLKHRLTDSTVSATQVDRRSNSSIRHALWEHCPDLQLRSTELSLCSGDALLIWQALQTHFPLLRIVDCTRFAYPEGSARPPMQQYTSPLRELARISPRHYTQRFSTLNARNCDADATAAEQWAVVPTQLINKSEPPLFMDPEVFLVDSSASRPVQDTIDYFYCVSAPAQFADASVRTSWLARLQEFATSARCSVVVSSTTPASLAFLPVDAVQVYSRNAEGVPECKQVNVSEGRPSMNEAAGIPVVRSWPNTHAF